MHDPYDTEVDDDSVLPIDPLDDPYAPGDAGHTTGGPDRPVLHEERPSEIKFGGGCDCGFSPGTCGAAHFCRWHS